MATFQQKQTNKQSHKNYYKAYGANHECVYFLLAYIIYHVIGSKLMLKELYRILYFCQLHTPNPSTKAGLLFILQTKCSTICFLWIHYKFLSDTKAKLPIERKSQDTKKESWFLSMPKVVGNVTFKDFSLPCI